MFVLGLGSALSIGLIARLHKWLIVLPIFAMGFFACVWPDDLRDPRRRGVLLNEMGYAYVAGGLAVVEVPLLCVVVLLVRGCRANAVKDRAGASGEVPCRRCAYNLFGNTSGACPECGAATLSDSASAVQ